MAKLYLSPASGMVYSTSWHVSIALRHPAKNNSERIGAQAAFRQWLCGGVTRRPALRGRLPGLQTADGVSAANGQPARRMSTLVGGVNGSCTYCRRVLVRFVDLRTRRHGVNLTESRVHVRYTYTAATHQRHTELIWSNGRDMVDISDHVFMFSRKCCSVQRMC